MTTANLESKINLPEAVVLAVEEAKNRSKRESIEIAQCQEGIQEHDVAADSIRSVKRQLTDSKRQHDLISNLSSPDGSSSWARLNETSKWKKSHVWAVLCASSALPFSLTERRWEQTVPVAIRHDRDLLLARMNRKEFSAHYNEVYSDNEFSLPEPFRGDKQVVLKLVEIWPKILLEDVLTPEMLSDQSVFRAMLKSDQVKKKPMMYDYDTNQRWHANRRIFLSKFSLKVRGNAACMLEAAKVLDEVVLEHVGEPLLGNCNFATSLVNTLETVPFDAFERFSKVVRSSKIASMAFVRKNGLSLRHVDKSLHGNEMVRAACKQNPTALSHCLSGRVKRALGRDKAFMRDIFSRLYPSQGDPAFYQMLSMMNKLDYGLTAAAYGTHCLTFSDLPRGLLYDHKFWKLVIEQENSDECPFADKTIVQHAFSHCPALLSDPVIWQSILYSDEMYCEIFDVLQKFAPKEILADKELMVTACEIDLAVMGLVADDLLHDEKFVESVVSERKDLIGECVLDELPLNVQRIHPRFVIEELNDWFEYGSGPPTDAVAEDVVEELWAENLDVARAWFDAGGSWHSLFPVELKDNESFGLVVAGSEWRGQVFQEGTWDVGFKEFKDATSAALRSKKSFMLQAVNANRRAFFTIESLELKKDAELVATACSGSKEESRKFIEKLLGQDDGNFEILRNARAYAQKKVAAFDAFTKGFMPGMMANADPDCHPRLLVGDEETTLALKKRIGSFVGMAMTGEEAAIMRRASRNLEWLSLNALRRDYYD